jgi:hypothetical protein
MFIQPWIRALPTNNGAKLQVFKEHQAVHIKRGISMRKLIFAVVVMVLALSSAPGWAAPEFELRQFTPYEDSEGNWHARGIVKNIGNEWGYYVWVWADLYDKRTGQFVESIWGMVFGDVKIADDGNEVSNSVGPGQWATFDSFIAESKYADVEYRNVSVSFSTSGAFQDPLANPVVTELSQYKDKAGMWRASGRVVNQGSSTAYIILIKCHLFSFIDEALGHQEDNYFYLGFLETSMDAREATGPKGNTWGSSLLPGAEGQFDYRTLTAGPHTQIPVPFEDVRYAKTTLSWSEMRQAASKSSSNEAITLGSGADNQTEKIEPYYWWPNDQFVGALGAAHVQFFDMQ